MEILLLWADELDDAMGALRHLLPRIFSFLIALALFGATGFAVVHTPHVAIPVLALALSTTLLEVLRRRRRLLDAHDDSAAD